jgi:hypothetical protein
MPLFAREMADERDGLCAMALGLSEDQARLAPLPRLWPIENWPAPASGDDGAR